MTKKKNARSVTERVMGQYGEVRFDFTESDVSYAVTSLQKAQVEYEHRYDRLFLASEQLCGCPYDCSCDPMLVLMGTREETAEEVAKRKRDDENHKRWQVEQLRKQAAALGLKLEE